MCRKKKTTRTYASVKYLMYPTRSTPVPCVVVSSVIMSRADKAWSTLEVVTLNSDHTAARYGDCCSGLHSLVSLIWPTLARSVNLFLDSRQSTHDAMVTHPCALSFKAPLFRNDFPILFKIDGRPQSLKWSFRSRATCFFPDFNLCCVLPVEA